MNSRKETKEKIYRSLETLLRARVDEALLAMKGTREARDNETKSSAGDKHETARAMMQIELENLERQLSKAESLLKELLQVNIALETDRVTTGSLVFTSQQNYFIAVGVGKVIVDSETYYAISLASPVGQLLKDKKVGDNVMFMGKEFIVQDIL